MKKAPDLSVRPACPPGQRIPSFRNQNRTPSFSTVAAASVIDVFKPNAACTVQWLMVQSSAACTIQLYLNGQPFGAALNVSPGTIIFFPGTLLVNDEKLSISVSAATTLNWEVVWIKDHYFEAVNQNVVISGGSIGLHKQTTIETTTPLAASAVFTGPWHDSDADGTIFVLASAFANVAGAGFAIQESDDITNTNFTHQIVNAGVSASTLVRLIGLIKCRYWRVVFTNSTTAQTSFELTTTGSDILGAVNSSVDVINQGMGILQYISSPYGVTNFLDNVLVASYTLFPALASANPLWVYSPIYGGKFSGTANAALQGWSQPRTPTVFKQISTAATGSTVLWTPGSGNKFRILKFKIQVTANAVAAAAGVLVIALEDAATVIPLSHSVFIPAAAGATLAGQYDSGWIDLGQFGYLSSAANNALNVNLSFALTGGVVNVIACGTEE